MYYPTIPVRRVERKVLDRFRGLNRNPRTGAGEFRDMENLTSDLYPVLSNRKKRGIYRTPASPQGMIAMNELCYVDGPDFFIGDTRIEMGLSVDPGDCPKKLQSMGGYVIILPDKMYINTTDPEDRGHIEAAVTVAGASFSLCREDGSAYEGAQASDTAPDSPQVGQLWLDTGGFKPVLKRYGTTQDSWEVSAAYVKISAPGIGAGFARFDGVTLSGCRETALNGSAVLWAVEQDYVVVAGILGKAFTQEEPLTLERRMPEMDFITQSENRLWGCRYGPNAQGKFVNEIYACKLGDFRNWSCFMGLSTDSYTASCGAQGPFTGAASQLGYPVFFREDCIHKIYGSVPASFQIQTTACQGVQAGSQESIARVGRFLVYKSPGEICAYDGSMPVPISAALGAQTYSRAAAGAQGEKYYISMMDEQGRFHLLVWDSARSLWHREDSLHCSAFCTLGRELFAIDAEGRNILGLLGTGEQEPVVKWMAETADLGLASPDQKYISRLTLRLTLEPDSRLECFAQYDGEQTWERLCVVFGTSLRSIRLPLRPRRCDHLRLRLEGTGPARLYSIAKTIEKGSDQS